MIRYRRTVATMIFLAAALAIAATQGSAVDGRWQGTMITADGPVTITYTFTTKGQTLIGTEESPMFSRSISDGKVNGENISFKTTVNGKSIDHEGTINGDTILFKNHGPLGEFDLTVKRVSGEKKSTL